MMAMVITAVIGLCVAVVSSAVTNAYSHNQKYYENVQNGRFGANYMQDALRRTKLITAGSTTELMLWIGDADCSGTIQNSELAYWKLDSKTGQVKECIVKYPANLKASLDATQKLSDLTTMSKASAILTGSSYAEWHVLAEGVTGFQATFDQAAPKTNYVKIGMTLGSGAELIRLRAAAAIRADSTSLVRQVNGVYVLDASN